MKVTVYGDSILKGVLFLDGKYTVDHRWERELAETLRLNVDNRSRFGNTIQKLLPVLRRDGAAEGEGGYALLEFGGNDCDYDWKAISAEPTGRYRCKTPPEQFLTLYREAIALLRGHGKTPVVLTLPPIHSERYLDFICRAGLSRENILHWLGDVEAISRWQETYSSLVRQVAREEQTALVDLRAAFPREPRALEELLCDDGIHPSRAGQRLIGLTLRDCARAVLPAPC